MTPIRTGSVLNLLRNSSRKVGSSRVKFALCPLTLLLYP